MLRPLLTGLLCCFLFPQAVHAGGAPDVLALQISPELTQTQIQASPAAHSVLPAPDPVPATGFTLTPDATQELRDELPPLPTIDLTTPPDDLWQRVRNGFGMADLHTPLVADRQAWYLNRPDMLKRIFERSRRYLHHIVTELEQRGMPTELALLPMVESAFNPLAYSSARALGMWQFIPSTGKNYKLDQNWWLDERRDIIASTNAALDYLQNIYEMHGDWHLALASYNWGEHAVARAIAKNEAKGLPTDYASLTMPGETRYYVPKLQALKNIIAQPELFGFRLDPIPNRPYFGLVDVPGDLDVALAAKLAEMPLDEFIALNPAYHRPLIRGDQKDKLLLPTDKVPIFLANVERYESEDKPLATWRTYTLKKGERLDAVAKRLGMTEARLKQLNGITKRVKVGPGFNLLVPAAGASVPEQLAAQLPKVPAEPPKADKRRGGKKKPAAKGRPVKQKAAPAPRKPATAKKKR